MSGTASAKEAQAVLDDEALVEEQLLDELENEEIPAHIREARMAAFKQQAREFTGMKEKQHGMYTEIVEEKCFLDMTTSEEQCVIHFYHSDFRRCAIMDKHLKIIAEKYFECKFAKINVDIAKFFVEKLKIRILPAVICFKNGIVVDRVVGFEELGDSDDFRTMVLEKRLSRSGVINAKDTEDDDDIVKGSILGKSKIKSKKDEDSDSDNDW